MNVRDYYAYLVAARKTLWDFLLALPDSDLNTALIQADRFHNIKDLLVHSIDMEEHWIHAVARGESGGAQLFPHNWVRPQAEQYTLDWITSYGRAVQSLTLQFLEGQPDLSATVKLVQDDPASPQVSLEQLMWHVMTHEVRHSAQISVLIRQLGHTPPWLDYFRFVRPE